MSMDASEASKGAEHLLDVFDDEMKVEYRGEKYLVRDNGAVYRQKMPQWKANIPVRRALHYDALQRLGLDTDSSARKPQDQQIILLNREAVLGDRHTGHVWQELP